MSDISSSSRPSRKRVVVVFLLLAVAVLTWWLWPSKPGSNTPKAEPQGPWNGPVPVRVGTVEQGDFSVELKALGTVTALNTVNVRPRVDGELVKVQFEEGQQVKVGDLLAQIDPRPYQVALQQAEGTLAQNQAQLKNAEIDLARYKGLYAEDSIAKQTLDTQEALAGQYRGTVKNSQAAVADARLNLEFTQIRAPVEGRLGLRQVDVGNLLSSGDTTPLVVITQVKPISVAFTLAENELPPVLERVRKGEKLLVQAWDRNEKKMLAEGYLHSLDNQIDTATGTVKIKARFANETESLFPNQFVNVRLRVQTRTGVILISSAALQYGSKGTFVFVLGADDKIQVRAVEVGASNGAQVLIEDGLKVGERIVLEGTDKLKEGSRVEVVADPGVDQDNPRIPVKSGT